jgi:thiol-disulfide isomerase/thioredoxin
VNAAPDIPLRTVDGTTATLSQLRGKVVVLNFWATWCLPCAAEMPSLERLAASRSADQIAVVAVSIDDGGADAVKRFLSLNGIRHLLVYLDPDQRLGSLYTKRAAGLLTLYGLPASYVIDRNGLVVGYIVGAAKWDSPEANRFLDHFLSGSYRPERLAP